MLVKLFVIIKISLLNPPLQDFRLSLVQSPESSTSCMSFSGSRAQGVEIDALVRQFSTFSDFRVEWPDHRPQYLDSVSSVSLF